MRIGVAALSIQFSSSFSNLHGTYASTSMLTTPVSFPPLIKRCSCSITMQVLYNPSLPEHHMADPILLHMFSPAALVVSRLSPSKRFVAVVLDREEAYWLDGPKILKIHLIHRHKIITALEKDVELYNFI